ncbi:biotin transporter BioY [Allosediminivita pacifica]|uniref:Biotin transporter n=1 Tax=Allosediminivita pacifica TaxID=1267769 RepID=A0A2T6ARV6_9RHOB|nr:biotin transporter BioY [Allosediminivita pacifica]PTX46476.1 biotin transport system substrate-specific component [Allosediminivita pacifica]GGB16879.1 biotin transporter BioY [Allosediminivita pacifica]
MSLAIQRNVLADSFGATEGAGLRAKQALLVVLGIGFMAAAAQVRVPMWPVPVTMQTFAVLALGAAYGARLGLVTLLGYLALGAAGVQVFTGDSAGLAYMAGPTGGYLVGFAAAAALMGFLARRGWDRSVTRMVAALLMANAVIYAFGLPWMAWLFLADKGAAWVMQWGMVNFLLGDALKLALAAMLLPAAWRLVERARG